MSRVALRNRQVSGRDLCTRRGGTAETGDVAETRPETPETYVLLLITQRSQIQILPLYQGRGPESNKVPGLFPLFVNAFCERG